MENCMVQEETKSGKGEVKMKNFDPMKIVSKLAAEISDKQKAYRDFFQKKLDEYGAKSPADLSDADKKKFFDEISKEWKSEKE